MGKLVLEFGALKTNGKSSDGCVAAKLVRNFNAQWIRSGFYIGWSGRSYGNIGRDNGFKGLNTWCCILIICNFELACNCKKDNFSLNPDFMWLAPSSFGALRYVDVVASTRLLSAYDQAFL